MGRKLVVLFLVLFAVSMGSLSAQEQLESNTPSEFDVGIILNYSYADLRDQNFKEYIPTLRFQWNMLPWLGLSATGYVNGEEYASLVLEAVLRAPLGLIEPYVATGPGYLVALSEDVPVSGTSNFAYNFRAGFDVNVTDWFSIGPGITLLIPDVVDFFQNISTVDMDYLKEFSLIGIGVKLRF